jgi:hypothetical protein
MTKIKFYATRLKMIISGIVRHMTEPYDLINVNKHIAESLLSCFHKKKNFAIWCGNRLLLSNNRGNFYYVWSIEFEAVVGYRVPRPENT